MKTTLTSTPATATDSMACVDFSSHAVMFLHSQLQIDIREKILDARFIHFSIFELLAMDRLLPAEITNVVISHGDCHLLAQYTAHQLVQASYMEDQELMSLYNEFLDALTCQATVVTDFLTWLR